MRIFINLIYLTFIILTLPYYLFKIITTASYRAGLKERLGFVPRRANEKPAIWLHGASVGEIMAAQGLIDGLKQKYPDYDIIISTLTPTGQAVAKKKYPGCQFLFFPIDLSFIIKRVFKRLQPNLIILIERELWPNFILTANKMNIPVIVVNGRLTEKSLRWYKILKLIMKRVLARIQHFALQNETYAQRYQALGVPQDKITVTGNMKYDIVQVADLINEKNSYIRLFQISPDEIVLIGGSTHAPEEETLLNVYKRLRLENTSLRLILAPRYPERFDEVERLITAKGFKCLRRSKIEEGASGLNDAIILIDVLGELLKVYSVADIVFVGGTMAPRGGHNILEPAGLGKPVFFGSSLYNFADSAEMLVNAGGARLTSRGSELYEALKGLMTQPEQIKKMGQTNKEIVLSQQGATQKNLDLISSCKFKPQTPASQKEKQEN